MKNIYRTPHQTACMIDAQNSRMGHQADPVEQAKPQVPEIRILGTWNEHRQHLIQTRLHLL